MTNLDYFTNIPNDSNDPSDDQPLMKTNTNSIGTWVGIDHYGFGVNAGGLHKQVTLPKLNAAPSIGANTGCVYVKTNSGSQLYYTNDGTGDQYQLTRADTINIATFGNFTNYVVPATTFGGWTFLPGGIRMQYGTLKSTGNNTTVIFPVAFTALYSVVIARQQTSTTVYGVSNPTTTGFVFHSDSNSAGINLFWMAMGS